MDIRTLIVEDEPLMRERLRGLLAEEPDVVIVGECANGPEAVAALDADRPDLVFLDVQMPGLNGFEVIEAVGVERMPATVFVTAYDRYALRAFEVHALDYLLKPFNRERFRQALERARGRLRQARPAEVHELLRALLADVQTAARGPRRLIVKSDNRIVLVKPEDVDWVEAAGNYVRLHVGKDEHLLRATMEGVEAQLPPRQFVRIHRSTIVNVERIHSMEPGFHGDYVVQLHDGTELPLSRTYRPKLEELLGRPL
jgi:two-component system, LytTR family, response regulator